MPAGKARSKALKRRSTSRRTVGPKSRGSRRSSLGRQGHAVQSVRRISRARPKPHPESPAAELNGPSADFVSRLELLLSSAAGANPAERRPPFVILGTADVGQLHFCDAKATYSQTDMEAAFGRRMLEIIRSNSQAPPFVRPAPEVLGLEVFPPREADDIRRMPDEGAPDYAIAEAEIAKGTWHIGYAAAFKGEAFGLPSDSVVYLAGILDGARDDGTVLEVRRTRWDFAGILSQGVNREKEVQANIYAVVLGMPRWECAFSCNDGIHRTQGIANRDQALAEIGQAARLRWRLAPPLAVGPRTSWKCKSRARSCDFLSRCEYTPVPQDQR